MGERKVLNKYIPPDFDPAKMPRGHRPKVFRCEVRMMMPFSAQCVVCGHYVYSATKLNSIKEDVVGEDYLGIRIYRFIMKCPACSAKFSIKTDPKNSDYSVEYGITRNFEPWREREAEEEEEKAAREEEEKTDNMKALENRTLESKRNMDIQDALDEVKALKSAHERVDTSALLDQYHEKKAAMDKDAEVRLREEQQAAEDEEEVRKAFARRMKATHPPLEPQVQVQQQQQQQVGHGSDLVTLAPPSLPAGPEGLVVAGGESGLPGNPSTVVATAAAAAAPPAATPTAPTATTTGNGVRKPMFRVKLKRKELPSGGPAETAGGLGSGAGTPGSSSGGGGNITLGVGSGAEPPAKKPANALALLGGAYGGDSDTGSSSSDVSS